MIGRRSLIVGAGIAAAAPKIVLADSLIDMPGNPLSKVGMRAAKAWAQTEFQDMPGCRLLFANGDATRWFYYQHHGRPLEGGGRTYAVAMEVRVPGPSGQSYVNSIPYDGASFANRWQRDAARVLRNFATEF